MILMKREKGFWNSSENRFLAPVVQNRSVTVLLVLQDLYESGQTKWDS